MRMTGFGPIRDCPIWIRTVAIVATSVLIMGAADPSLEEAQSLIPWEKIEEKAKAKIEDVVNKPTVHHRSASEVFACSPELYLMLLHDPVLTLEMWKTLGMSGVTLEQVSPGQYQGSDGRSTSGRWEFVYQSADLNVIYSEGEYRGPLMGASLQTRSVLVLRSTFFEERDGKKYVKHQMDAFVRAESGSLKPLTKALRPLFLKSVEMTVQETLWFVSLMCRYTMHDPHAVAQAVEQMDKLPQSVKAQMLRVLAPVMAATPQRKTSAGGIAAGNPN